MKVIIVGIGDLGYQLAGMLLPEPDHELVLVDASEERCTMLAESTDALVIHGDGTHPDILINAKISEADALVATTGSDPLNTVIGMLGRHFEVPEVIVKLSDTALTSACSKIGVSHVSMPKVAAAAQIRDRLYGIERIDLSWVAFGGMRVTELTATKDLGRIADGPFPKGALVLSLRRGKQVLFPRPEIAVEKGDRLVFLVDDADTLEKLGELV